MSRVEPALGVYVQQLYRPLPWLGFNVGGRVDADPRYNAAHVSPRAAVTVSPWHGGTLRAIYAEAFRSPTAFETDPGAGWVPNASLRPEVVRSVEGSVKQRFGAQRIFVGAFRSWWSDMITLATITGAELAKLIAEGQVPADFTSTSQYQNLASIENFGFNGGFDGAAFNGRLRYALTLTGAYSRTAVQGRHEHPAGRSGAVRQRPRLLSAWGRASHARPRRSDARPQGGRPGARGRPSRPTRSWAPSAAFRPTLSGKVPRVQGLSYRIMASINTAPFSPYVVGPNQYATATQPAAELSPIDRFRLTMGLRYDLMP